MTIRGSGFQSGATVSVGGKSAPTTFVDMDTLKFSLPAAVSSGSQRLLISNPGCEMSSVNGAFNVN
jgi:hypothetical protein